MAKENENGQERSEQPSGKRIQDARDKGQVCKSTEVSTCFLFLGTVISFYFYIPSVAEKLGKVMSFYIGNASAWDGSLDSLVAIFHQAVIHLGILVLPILVIFLAIGIASNILQFGFVFSGEPIVPKFSKLNPVTGFKNKFFSLKSLELLVKTIIILIVISWVAYRAIRREVPIFPPLIDCDLPVIVLTFFQSSMHLLWDFLWIFIMVAVADYAFQRWQHTRDLMMTKQEVKEEYKQHEGDPMIRSRIRSIQMHMARRRMMKEVPKADVVITNPTHLAVALKYERGKMVAPVVLAKGAGHLAEKIREIARAGGIPVVEDKPLAQALYKTVEIGDVIPEEWYKAVAEILAYVYRLKAGIR
ncbi:MAG: Flagellar biosynthetic protein FlhB [Deltaproteobacteria bacterium ADurb.BinA179]|jgi:flagellar biosynthetic protein FlhB|nr:MAG: Flagellar biosynthetic protein FlhB [Deltaproteobacteria bacterium ADurb.BinA179]HNU73740.1 flagellar biosynthesis protein FlhB [Deltaproteobacteria bacterium]HOD69567.1 flagellar biosynthesis protein FlhB [Deltaproteobacteria bacterium]HON60284.1 flagellar biosynthesis protein FlhB [Deltaproteobacteria bacterium]HPV28575.1 flagellar biosynthesis protein FlhB [Deltaproteobacteria bacterium]